MTGSSKIEPRRYRKVDITLKVRMMRATRNLQSEKECINSVMSASRRVRDPMM